MEKKTYFVPNTKIKALELEQHLAAASPDINDEGTDVHFPGTGGGGNANDAYGKSWSLWDDEDEIEHMYNHQ